MPDLPPNLDAYRMCREEGRHEQDILSGRLSAFMVSQSFLVSAYAVAMNNSNAGWGHVFRLAFPGSLSIVGLVLALRATPGIRAAVAMIRHWHKRGDALLQEDPALQVYYSLAPNEQTQIHERDIAFAATATYIFGTAWIAFGLLALFCWGFRG